ncbi:MAG: guanylate cyclase, partial [Prochlorotrichaceae cyanobacterium]
MTSAPLSKSAFSSPAPITDEASPVLVLKELVAKLNREQTKTQDLLSSLGFALRSFTNLNQFLELVPLMASRVTDADGGALIIFRANGQMRLERIHCSDESSCHDLRRVLEESVQSLSLGQEQRGETAQLMRFLDDRLSQRLSPDIQIFGTAVLNKNLERGRLYVFSYSPGYVWTDARQKLVRLVADQTAVAIENDELTAELRQKERLDRELEIGAEIQRQLLPRHC